jgi:hypothetical protein
MGLAPVRAEKTLEDLVYRGCLSQFFHSLSVCRPPNSNRMTVNGQHTERL